MPANNPPDLVLLYNASAAGAGLAIGCGMQMRYAVAGLQAKPNQNQNPKYIKVFCLLSDSATGAVAVVQPQTSPDNTTWSSLGPAITLTVPAAAPFYKGLGTNNDGFLFKYNPQFFRLNITSLTGGTAPRVNAYGTFGGYGA